MAELNIVSTNRSWIANSEYLFNSPFSVLELEKGIWNTELSSFFWESGLLYWKKQYYWRSNLIMADGNWLKHYITWVAEHKKSAKPIRHALHNDIACSKTNKVVAFRYSVRVVDLESNHTVNSFFLEILWYGRCWWHDIRYKTTKMKCG